MMIGLYRIPVWGYGVGSILRGVFRWRLLVKACMFVPVQPAAVAYGSRAYGHF